MTAPEVPPGLRRRGQLAVLAWPAFDGHPVDVLVTGRQGGVSAGPYESLNLGLHVGDSVAAVLENRRRAAAALGADLRDLVFCNQSHGRNVHVVTSADRGRGTLSQDDAIAATDALVTTEPGIGLVVMVADCVPIVLYDPVARVLSCVHAGWRGTVARVSEAAVEAMAGLGSDRADIIAGIGPAISPDRYQVGSEVAEQARRCFGAHGTDDVLRPDGTGKWLFDLWSANRIVLREAGLRDGNIHLAAVPTGPADISPFFSDRAARPCGRFAAVARLRRLIGAGQAVTSSTTSWLSQGSPARNVRGVEFHAVRADLRRVERSLDEGALDGVKLGLRGGPAKRLTRMRETRRAQRDEIGVRANPSRSPHRAGRSHRHVSRSRRYLRAGRMTPDPAALDAAIRKARHLLFAFDGPIRRTDTESPLDSATPTAPYIYEAFAACRETDRSVAVISTKAKINVSHYLDAHDLFESVTVIAISVADAIKVLELSPADCLYITSSPADLGAAQAAGVSSIGYARAPDDAARLSNAGAIAFVPSMADLFLTLRSRPLPG